MIPSQQQNHGRGYTPEIRWVGVKNTDATAAPPYAVMGVTGVSDDGAVLVARPTGNAQAYLINSGGTIAAGACGQGHNTYPAIVAYDTDATPPAATQTWGPVANSWTLDPTGAGFMILGGSSSGLTTAMTEGGGGSLNGMWWVRILCAAVGPSGYPGLVQSYDSDTETYEDVNGVSVTFYPSITSGVHTVTPSSLTGIAIGTPFMLIDGLCNSQVITPTAISGANFTANFTDAATAHGISSVTMTNPGSGYAGSGIPPTVSFTGGGGSGATGTAVLDALTLDTVASVTITNPGKDYTSVPTVVFNNSGTSGSGAAGTAVVSGPIKIYLSAVWVQFVPGTSLFTPAAVDVSLPVVRLARQEENAPDGIAVYVAPAGQTFIANCTDGSSFTVFDGRIVQNTPAP
jgi:hypothetical protein